MRTCSFVLFLSLWLAAFADDKVVVTQTAKDVTYDVSTLKELVFDGKGVKILFADGDSVYFTTETLVKITFSAAPTSIGETNHVGRRVITLQGNVVAVSGEPCNIKVLSPTGKIVAQNHGISLDISALPGGVYVVQAGGLISKIVKR